MNRFSHIDTTGFHTDGHYNSDQPPGEEEQIIHITRGYSRDHRPDLNQVMLQLICERQAGIPLLMSSLSGNSSDKESFREVVGSHVAQLQEAGLEYLVADSALYTSETLQAMDSVLWITRVPETLSQAKEVIDSFGTEMMYHPEVMSFRSLQTSYAGVTQRWLLVYSPQAHERALKTVNRRHLKQSQMECRTFEELCSQEFSCADDAQKAQNVFCKTQRFTTIESPELIRLRHFTGRGRPAKDRQPDYCTWRIQAALSCSVDKRQNDLRRKSCFILATNQLDEEALSDKDLLATYKDQQKVERGFRFLKDPMFMASTLFLKSPERIMALMMVMTLCLLVYAALEYRMRQAFVTAGATFPDQKGKPCMKPTIRRVFQCFSGIHVLIVNQLQEIILNLEEHHIILLKLMGKSYEELYSSTG